MTCKKNLVKNYELPPSYNVKKRTDADYKKLEGTLATTRRNRVCLPEPSVEIYTFSPSLESNLVFSFNACDTVVTE